MLAHGIDHKWHERGQTPSKAKRILFFLYAKAKDPQVLAHSGDGYDSVQHLGLSTNKSKTMEQIVPYWSKNSGFPNPRAQMAQRETFELLPSMILYAAW